MTTGNADVDRWLTAVAAGAPPLNGAQIETISKLMSRNATNAPIPVTLDRPMPERRAA